MEKTGDLLFEYLKNILYHPERAQLNPEALPEEFQKLGQGLVLLNDYVQEERYFARTLARGDLFAEPPSVDNMLAANLKELQGSLRHLTWQIQQVANGDYSQHVDFMGEFSEALNTMTMRLAEKRRRLTEEKERAEQRAVEMKAALDLAMALTNYTNNIIYVFSEEDGELVFANQSAEWFSYTYPKMAERMRASLIEHGIEGTEGSERWDMELESDPDAEGDKMYFWTESFRTSIEGTNDIVHIVIDDTKRRSQSRLCMRWHMRIR